MSSIGALASKHHVYIFVLKASASGDDHEMQEGLETKIFLNCCPLPLLLVPSIELLLCISSE